MSRAVLWAVVGIGVAGVAAGAARVYANRTAKGSPATVASSIAPLAASPDSSVNAAPDSSLSAASASASDELRVCADPNNMPFSNERGEGFENRIANAVARALGRRLTYSWMPQRRGFIRNTLNARRCDLVVGVPAGYDLVLTTQPYYTSTYVFVTRGDRRRVSSLDDRALRTLRIGIQITGDDYENPPGAQALAARSLAANVRGYTVYGDYSKPDPQRAVIDAVARGEVDTAIVWGPLAGYFAARDPIAMEVTPVSPAIDRLSGRFTFAIAMGVRKDDGVFRDTVERAIAAQRDEIRRILREYRVPIVRTRGREAGALK